MRPSGVAYRQGVPLLRHLHLSAAATRRPRHGDTPKLSVFSADLIYFISLCRGPVVRGMVRPPQGVQGSHFGVIWGHLKKYVFDRVFASFYVQHAKSRTLLGVYWLYLGGVYPVCKSEASSHRSAGRPHKNIDREGAREGEFLSRISTNKKASSAIQNDVGSERNG